MGVRPPDVLADEVRDHLIRELLLEIDDVVGDADPGGHAPRVVEIVDRAAGAEALDFEPTAPLAPLVLPATMIVQLHRQTDNLVALPRQ